MNPPTPETQPSSTSGCSHTVLRLSVRNHPGVMSHVCGLFARRGYNVEGILCMPLGKAERSHIWLLVHEGERLEQMIRQAQKLEDVFEVQRRRVEHEEFLRLERFFETGQPQ